MAMNHARMPARWSRHSATAQRPLWVAYYRRALPRFLKVRELLRANAIGTLTSVHVKVTDPLATGECREGVALQHGDRRRGAVSRSRLALLRHHRLSGRTDHRVLPVSRSTPAAPMRPRTSRLRPSRSATRSQAPACGISTRRRPPTRSCLPVHKGRSRRPFAPTRTWSSRAAASRTSIAFAIPPHVHQPLIQTIVDELRGQGTCESTGESGARSAWVMDRCLESYYKAEKVERW